MTSMITPPEATPAPPDDDAHGLTFWIGLATGAAVMAYAVWGVFHDHLDTNPPFLLKWVLGLLLFHDLIVAPIVAAVILIVRKLPPRLVGPIGGALALSAIVTVYSIPLVRAFGRHDLNSSTLPHEYLANLFVVLAAIWIMTACVILWRARASTTADRANARPGAS